MKPWSWLDNAYTSDVDATGGFGCFAPDLVVTTVQDNLNPLAGLVNYLVTAENCSGESTLGFETSGLERQNSAPCP